MKQSPETRDSSRSVLTHICGAIVDKDGREVERFCIAVRSQSATSSGTPSANNELTCEDLWGTPQPQLGETPNPPGNPY